MTNNVTSPPNKSIMSRLLLDAMDKNVICSKVATITEELFILDKKLAKMMEEISKILPIIRMMKPFLELPGFPSEIKSVVAALLPLSELKGSDESWRKKMMKNPKVIGSVMMLMKFPGVETKFKGIKLIFHRYS